MNTKYRNNVEIKDFWKDQVVKHGTSVEATMPDFYLKELELDAITRALIPDVDTIEIGCGNGYNLFSLKDYFSRRLVGVDYVDEMIKEASKQQKEQSRDIEFYVGDVLGDLSSFGTFTQLFTIRCLINLTSIDDQITAVENMANLLRPGGLMALIEPTIQSQNKLNNLRESAGLDAINYHWHNLYIDEEKFIDKLPKGLELIFIDRFSSTYYIASRIFNALMTSPGESPDYKSKINEVARGLPSIGDYGPHKLFLIKKK